MGTFMFFGNIFLNIHKIFDKFLFLCQTNNKTTVQTFYYLSIMIFFILFSLLLGVKSLFSPCRTPRLLNFNSENTVKKYMTHLITIIVSELSTSKII